MLEEMVIRNNLETSFPNIDETNNVFVYSPDNGNLWVKIKIPGEVMKLMT